MSARRRGESESHMIGELFTFALFGIFLLLSLLIVVIGVQAYRGAVDTAESVGGIRTSLGYVAGKVRSGGTPGDVTIEHLDGVDVLVLRERYDDTTYATFIYHTEGALYEAYMRADEISFEQEDGDPLIEIEDFQMAWAGDNLLALTATTKDGRSQTLHLALRPQQEVSE